MDSSFVVDAPVSGPQFYDRQDLLVKLTADDHALSYIIGGRKMGKTSLLNQIKLEKPALQIQVENEDDSDALSKKLITSLAQTTSELSWLPNPATLNQDDFLKLLEKIIKANDTNQKQIYLLVDDSHNLINPNFTLDFLYRFKKLAANSNNLTLIMAASRQLSLVNDLCRKAKRVLFLESFTPFFLIPFTDDESYELLDGRHYTHSLNLPTELGAKICRFTGGHPYLLQLMGNYLYQEGKWLTIGEDILTEIDPIATEIFAYDFKTFTNTERQILRLIGHHHQISFGNLQNKIPDARLSILLEGLVSDGYLRRLERDYTTGSIFLDRWLEKLPLRAWDTLSPIPEDSPFELIGKDEQLKSIENLLSIHRQNLEHYQKIEDQYGFDCPLYVLNGIAFEENQIAQLKVELEVLNR